MRYEAVLLSCDYYLSELKVETGSPKSSRAVPRTTFSIWPNIWFTFSPENLRIRTTNCVLNHRCNTRETPWDSQTYQWVIGRLYFDVLWFLRTHLHSNVESECLILKLWTWKCRCLNLNKKEIDFKKYILCCHANKTTRKFILTLEK